MLGLTRGGRGTPRSDRAERNAHLTCCAAELKLDLDWKQSIKMALLWPLKRDYLRPRSKVIVRFGTTGTDEDFLDPGPTEPDDKHSEVIRARKTGELFFYVNDAVLAIPGLADYFYRDNIGEAEVVIERR